MKALIITLLLVLTATPILATQSDTDKQPPKHRGSSRV